MKRRGDREQSDFRSRLLSGGPRQVPQSSTVSPIHARGGEYEPLAMATTFLPWRGILGILVGALADRSCWPWLGYPFAACRRSVVANGLGRPSLVSL